MVGFSKGDGESEIRSSINNIFRDKLQGRDFEFLKPVYRQLHNISLQPGEEFDGYAMSEMYHKKAVYVRPLEELPKDEEIAENEANDVIPIPGRTDEEIAEDEIAWQLHSYDLLYESRPLTPPSCENPSTESRPLTPPRCENPSTESRPLTPPSCENPSTETPQQNTITGREILENLKLRIKTDQPAVEVEVERPHLLRDLIAFIKGEGFDPSRNLKIIFKGEPIVDFGGGLRECFRIALSEIKCQIFEGPNENLYLSRNNKALRENLYLYAGIITALAIIHCEQWPIMSNYTFWKLVDPERCKTPDYVDLNLRKILNEILAAEDPQTVNRIISDNEVLSFMGLPIFEGPMTAATECVNGKIFIVFFSLLILLFYC